jgi:WD40 repeat protein
MGSIQCRFLLVVIILVSGLAPVPSRGQELRSQPFEERVRRFALSGDGERLAYVDPQRETDQQPDGRGATFFDIKVVQPRTFTPCSRVRCLGRPDSLVFAPDGVTLAVVTHKHPRNPNTMVVVNSRTGQEIRQWEAHEEGTACAFTPDGKRLVTCGIKAPGPDRQGPQPGLSAGEITVWDRTTGVAVATWKHDRAGMLALSLSPNGALVAVGCENGQVMVLDTATLKLQHDWTSGTNAFHEILAWFPDGRSLVVFDDATYVWNLATGKANRFRGITDPQITGQRQTSEGWDDFRVGNPVFDKFLPGPAPWLIVVNNGRLALIDFTKEWVWDLEPPTRLRNFGQLALSADGKTLATFHGDKILRIWDVTKLLEDTPAGAKK